MENVIVLPQVEVLNSISDSAKILVEQEGEINRFAIANLDIGGGDVSVDLDNAVDGDKPLNPMQHKSGSYFYPLTMSSQVILEDNSKLSTYLETVATKNYVQNMVSSFSSCPFVVQATAPTNTNLL